MKTVLILAVIVVIALVTYNFISTGQFKVIPNTEPTGEAAQLRDLEKRLHKAFDAYRDTSDRTVVDDFNAPSDRLRIKAEIDDIASKIKELKAKSKAIEIRGQAEKLLDEITEFRMDVS